MHLETFTARGVNPARPFAIRPPLSLRIEQPQILEAGQPFHFQIVLFGDAVGYVPYIVQAVYRAGDAGIGKGKGRFHLMSVLESNPFTRTEATLYSDGKPLQPSKLSITAQDIQAVADQLDSNKVTLQFLTPMQITEIGRTAQTFHFHTWIARLLERCQALESTYSDIHQPHEVWRDLHFHLTEAAQNVQLIRDDTRWVDVWSRSGRTGHLDNIGGFVGSVTLLGDTKPFRYWLTYGQLLQVGKNAVKGNGWYEVLSH